MAIPFTDCDRPMELIPAGIIAIALYLASASWLAYRLANSGGNGPLPLYPALAGLVIHGWVLSVTLFRPGGIDLGFFHATSLVAWLIVALLLISSTLRPITNLGIVLLPAAALALATEILFPDQGHPLGHLAWSLQLHILISVTAYSLFAIAAVQAVVLAAQDRQLHNRRPGGIIRALPPLAVMEQLLFQLITLAFILLTLGLFSGAFHIHDLLAQHLAHKTFFAISAWLIFAGLLWGRWQRGWRGRKAIRLTLAGFILLAIAFFGTKLVLEIVIGR
jgi:ABC-type uncharacterized transport system permease subunit